ncbi:MAG: RecX family transcriptional regulator [candidate division KSB1 bacterium]|nr:RecX family transcriptional regulator [candidate division KSB1 bacterium]
MAPRITRIEPQKRRKGRFSVFVDEEYAFSVDAELLALSSLAEGQEIDEARVEELRHESELRYAKERAYRLLAVRDRSEAEMRQRLARIGFGSATVEEVIRILKQQRYLDDRCFALRYSQGLLSTHPVGRVELEKQLRQKGVEEAIVDEVVEDVLPPETEAELARREAIRRVCRYRAEQDRGKVKARVVAYLARRGFTWGVVQDLIEHWQEIEEQARDGKVEE